MPFAIKQHDSIGLQNRLTDCTHSPSSMEIPSDIVGSCIDVALLEIWGEVIFSRHVRVNFTFFSSSWTDQPGEASSNPQPLDEGHGRYTLGITTGCGVDEL